MNKNWFEFFQVIEEGIRGTLKGIGKVFFALACAGLALGSVLDRLKKKKNNNN